MTEKTEQDRDYKICPFRFSLERYATHEGTAVVDAPCVGERCALWNSIFGECGLIS